LPGERRYAGAGSENEDLAAEPDFGKDTKGDGEEDVVTSVPSGARRFEEEMAAREQGSRAAATGKSAEGAELKPADGSSPPGSRDASGEARLPGWEGTGRAIDESPLVDYRARFERQLSETTGTETTLGSKPSAEMVSAAISEYYASFDARVAVEQPVDPGLALAMEAWMKAFGAGLVP